MNLARASDETLRKIGIYRSWVAEGSNCWTAYYWHNGTPISATTAQEMLDKASTLGFPEDPVIDANVQRLISRAKQGMKDYGVSMDKAPGGAVSWIDHTIEELLDAANYLEKLKRTLA